MHPGCGHGAERSLLFPLHVSRGIKDGKLVGNHAHQPGAIRGVHACDFRWRQRLVAGAEGAAASDATPPAEEIIRPERPLRSHDNPVERDGIETHFGHWDGQLGSNSNELILVCWQKKAAQVSLRGQSSFVAPQQSPETSCVAMG